MYDVIIIGSGPAGLSCAIYVARANRKVLVLEDENFGGKLNKIYKIENYPGFSSILGGELASNLYEHAKTFDVEIRQGLVKNLKNKTIVLDNGETLEARAIVVASGVKEKAFDLPNAKDFIGKGISYCAVCDGFFFKGKDVVVYGSDRQAIEDALYLSTVANKVYLCSPREQFNSEEKLINDVNNNEKVEVIKNVIPKELVIENGVLKGLALNDRTIECSGIFPHVGVSPNTVFLDTGLLNEKGYLKVNEHMETSKEGIFGAGDVIEKELRQVVTACSDGTIAATSVSKYLNQK